MKLPLLAAALLFAGCAVGVVDPPSPPAPPGSGSARLGAEDAGADVATVSVTLGCAEPDGAPAPCFGDGPTPPR